MTRLLNSIRARWLSFWFAPAAATNLGVSRLLFFGPLAAFYIPHNFSIWGSVSPALPPANLVVRDVPGSSVVSGNARCGGNGMEAVAGSFVPGPFHPAQHGGSCLTRHLSARAAPQFRADLPFRCGTRARLLDSGVLSCR